MTLDMSQQAVLRAVLTLVERERERQEVKFPDQHVPDGTGPGAMWLPGRAFRADEVAELLRVWTDRSAADGSLTWRHILTEEVAEALAEDDPVGLFRELIQVAAVAVRWASEPRLLNAFITAGVAEDAPLRELIERVPLPPVCGLCNGLGVVIRDGSVHQPCGACGGSGATPTRP